MKGQEKFIIVIFAIIFLVIALYLFLNPPKQPPYTPDIRLDLSRYDISIKDNQTSAELIRATITKLDEKEIPTRFQLKFVPSNPDYLYPVDDYGRKITEITTDELISKGREYSYQFKVFGKKVLGQTTSQWSITVEVFFNNTKLEGKEKTLTVTVT